MTPELWKLLTDKESVRFWDIDGVLAQYEYSERNHNACKESEWGDFIKQNPHFYHDNVKPIKVIQDFIALYGDYKRDYVISCTYDLFELGCKISFVDKYYPIIPRDNIFRAETRTQKLLIMRQALDLYIKNTPPKNVIMIDDTTDVLSYIQENSDFTTIHISSFLDEELIKYMSKRTKV